MRGTVGKGIIVAVKSLRLVSEDRVEGAADSVRHLCPQLKRTGVTKPGQTIRIKGEGMPKHGTPSEYGDLTITFTVDFPQQAMRFAALVRTRILCAKSVACGARMHPHQRDIELYIMMSSHAD